MKLDSVDLLVRRKSNVDKCGDWQAILGGLNSKKARLELFQRRFSGNKLVIEKKREQEKIFDSGS